MFDAINPMNQVDESTIDTSAVLSFYLNEPMNVTADLLIGHVDNDPPRQIPDQQHVHHSPGSHGIVGRSEESILVITR
jgi:hypothetical protein